MHSFMTNMLLGDLRFEVHFDKYYAPDGVRYLVNVRNRTGDSYYFIMERNNGKWRIVNPLIVNDLFVNNQHRFSEAINLYLGKKV
jgi:acid phosphatase class B